MEAYVMPCVTHTVFYTLNHIWLYLLWPSLCNHACACTMMLADAH